MELTVAQFLRLEAASQTRHHGATANCHSGAAGRRLYESWGPTAIATADDLLPRSGVITQIDHQALVRIAEAGDCVLTLLPVIGDFVPAGARLFERSAVRLTAP